MQARAGRVLTAGSLWFAMLPSLAVPAVASAGVDWVDLEIGESTPRAVSDLGLNAGPARIRLVEGVLWPIGAVGGRVVEWIFVGNGEIRLDPPDEIESAQLELFTGSGALEEKFDSAVVVIASDEAGELLGLRSEATTGQAEASRAKEIAAEWRGSAERRLLEVDSILWADAVGERLLNNYFVAWIDGAELGKFLYVVDPMSREQVTLGRFEPIEADRREQRRIERQLQREQKRGRLLGQRFEDLGVFDNWVSTVLHAADGEARPGASPFEPVHYGLDVRVDDELEEIALDVEVEVASVVDGARVVPFQVHPDMTIDAVSVGGGVGAEGVRWKRGRGLLVVGLPEPVAKGERVRVELECHGPLIERERSRRIALRDTEGWYPHVGTVDRATYDVRLEWPKRVELLAGGRRLEGGAGPGGRSWERRVLDRPSMAFGFEIGRYRIETFEASGISVRLAFDPDGRDLGKDSTAEIRKTITSGLAFLSEKLSPLPDRELTVVSTPRSFSQSLPGFVTLSNFMMTDLGWLGNLLGFEDRRTVVVHELAHQWWGNSVGWSGYRDQWLSEAIANYLALVWSRTELEREDRPSVGPTSGWRRVLLAETEDGHTVESLGPVVAGFRLSSSKSDSAYAAIVYKKGAIVLDMIANAVGSERFLSMLGKVTELAAGRTISTEDFLDAVEKLSGSGVEDFSRRYVYGTGVPEVVYDYRIEPNGEKWVVEGSARLEENWERVWRVERESDGRFVVRSSPTTRTDTARDAVIAPLQIGLFLEEKADEKERKRVARGEEPVANALLTGRIAIHGKPTPFRFEVEYRPTRLWIDRDREAFGNFYDLTRSPKLAAIRRARDLEAEGDAAAAARTYSEALESPLDPSEDERGDSDQERVSRRVDALVRLSLAAMALDREDVPAAARELEAAREPLHRKDRTALSEQFALIEGRIALARGDMQEAWKALRKADGDEVETWIYRALAAKGSNRSEDLRTAIRRAERLGADLSALH